jgi:hypothetical protein
MFLVEQLMDEGFDPAYVKQTRYKGGLGHAFARPLKSLLSNSAPAIEPVMVNTYYPPVPSPRRCIHFGQALHCIIERFPEESRVAIVASGGLSHTKVIEPLDRDLIAALRNNDLEFLASMSPEVLIEGTSEIRNWIIVAAAADGARFDLVDYQPLYRTTNGVGCGRGFARWQPER